MAALKGVVDLAESMFENVGEADQDGQRNTPRLELVYELLEVDGVIGSFVGMNGDMTFLVDREVILPPVLDVVAINRILNCPVFHRSLHIHSQKISTQSACLEASKSSAERRSTLETGTTLTATKK